MRSLVRIQSSRPFLIPLTAANLAAVFVLGTSLSKRINIEGITSDEVLNLSNEELDQLVFIGWPIVFHVGSAEILGEFKLDGDTLVIELAQIDGGGEGEVAVTGFALSTVR